MNPIFILNPGETILRQEAGALILEGLRSRLGQVILTDQRIVFVKNSLAFAMMLGLIGVLIEHLLEKRPKTILLELPFNHILNFEHTRFRLNNKVIAFHTRDGNVHKIGTTKPYAEWEPELKKALKK